MTVERNGTLQTLIIFPSYLTTSVFLPWLCKLIKWMFSSICNCIHLPFIGCSRKPQALLNCTIWPLLSMQLQCKMLRNPMNWQEHTLKKTNRSTIGASKTEGNPTPCSDTTRHGHATRTHSLE